MILGAEKKPVSGLDGNDGVFILSKNLQQPEGKLRLCGEHSSVRKNEVVGPGRNIASSCAQMGAESG